MFLLHGSRKKWLKEGNSFTGEKEEESVMKTDNNIKRGNLITSQKQLEELINKEKEGISKDKELKKKFLDIEKLIQKNVTVRGLRPTYSFRRLLSTSRVEVFSVCPIIPSS